MRVVNLVTATVRRSIALYVVGMALTILAVMTWAIAQESSTYPIYRPQLLLLY
jgi:hypothetical protein